MLKYKGYLGSVEVSLEDKCLHGKLLHVRDVVSYEGDTVEELRCSFHEAVDDYLETCAELKRDPQKPFCGTFNVRVGPELHREAVTRAEIKGVSLNDVMRAALKDYIQHSEVQHSNAPFVIRSRRSEWVTNVPDAPIFEARHGHSSQIKQEDKGKWIRKPTSRSSQH